MTTTLDYRAALAARFAPRTHHHRATVDTPATLAARLDTRFRRTPALDHIDGHLTRTLTTPDARLIVSLPPQEGKSTLITKWGPVWLLARRPASRIVVASNGSRTARRMGRLIRSEVVDHTAPLAISLRRDVTAQDEFEIAGQGGGVYSVGVGGQLTGRPADALWIDDPVKDREQADSTLYRERVWEWWTDVAAPRLAPGAPVVLVLTRWHEDDLAGRLMKDAPGRWTVVNIPAQADSPDDPLGRPLGEFLVSARGRTTAQWEDRKATSGARTWASLYQGRPTPAEGGQFKARDLRYYTTSDGGQIGTVLHVAGRNAYLRDAYRFITCDVAASVRTSADYTVASAWAHTIDGDLLLLDRVRSRVTDVDHGRLVEPLARKWAVDFVGVEDSGRTVNLASHLGRAGIPVRPLKADADKVTRSLPATLRAERGGLYLPTADAAPWLGEFVDELLAFPGGAHDDQVDTLSYAARIVAGTHATPVTLPTTPDGLDDLTFGLVRPDGEASSTWDAAW